MAPPKRTPSELYSAKLMMPYRQQCVIPGAMDVLQIILGVQGSTKVLLVVLQLCTNYYCTHYV